LRQVREEGLRTFRVLANRKFLRGLDYVHLENLSVPWSIVHGCGSHCRPRDVLMRNPADQQLSHGSDPVGRRTQEEIAE